MEVQKGFEELAKQFIGVGSIIKPIDFKLGDVVRSDTSIAWDYGASMVIDVTDLSVITLARVFLRANPHLEYYSGKFEPDIHVERFQVFKDSKFEWVLLRREKVMEEGIKA